MVFTVSASKSAGNLLRISAASSSITTDGVRPSPPVVCFGNVRRILSKS
jgi:hypothetical protein